MVFSVFLKTISVSLFLTILPSSVFQRSAFIFSSSIVPTILTAISSTLLRSLFLKSPQTFQS